MDFETNSWMSSVNRFLNLSPQEIGAKENTESIQSALEMLLKNDEWVKNPKLTQSIVAKLNCLEFDKKDDLKILAIFQKIYLKNDLHLADNQHNGAHDIRSNPYVLKYATAHKVEVKALFRQ